MVCHYPDMASAGPVLLVRSPLTFLEDLLFTRHIISSKIKYKPWDSKLHWRKHQRRLWNNVVEELQNNSRGVHFAEVTELVRVRWRSSAAVCGVRVSNGRCLSLKLIQNTICTFYQHTITWILLSQKFIVYLFVWFMSKKPNVMLTLWNGYCDPDPLTVSPLMKQEILTEANASLT